MKKKLSDFRIDYNKFMDSLQVNWKTLLFTSLGTILLMAIISAFVFFSLVESPERVMVPNVTGELLEEALLDMQVKELYPKIQLRYSNSPNDKGVILEQDPPAGSIVKAGRRINLVVSRGSVIDRIGNYVGQTLDDVRISLQTLFSGSSVQLIKLPDAPTFMASSEPAGTIIEQDPLPDTAITSPITMSLIVSSGTGNETTKVPWLVGMSLNDALLQMGRSKIVFNFTARTPNEGEEAGVVVAQKIPGEGEPVPIYSSSDVTITLPDTIIDNNVYGLFETTLPSYPYALKVDFEVITPDGDKYSIVSMNHPGGKLTIPYAVPRFSILVLSVQGKEISRTTAE